MPDLTLERLLAKLGFGSRKESRALVRMGLVSIHQKTIEDPFLILDTVPETIFVNGEEIPTFTEVYLMLHKPEGYECSHKPQHHPSVFSLLPERFLEMDVRCVGRLDVDTSGLLLFSNQGNFIHQMESPKKGIIKKYAVTLARPFTEEQKTQLLKGVHLRNEKRIVQAKEIQVFHELQITVSIQEGLYHQVRRMLAAVGNHVEKLHRESVGNLTLDHDFPSGKWRFLTKEELT